MNGLRPIEATRMQGFPGLRELLFLHAGSALDKGLQLTQISASAVDMLRELERIVAKAAMRDR